MNNHETHQLLEIVRLTADNPAFAEIHKNAVRQLKDANDIMAKSESLLSGAQAKPLLIATHVEKAK